MRNFFEMMAKCVKNLEFQNGSQGSEGRMPNKESRKWCTSSVCIVFKLHYIVSTYYTDHYSIIIANLFLVIMIFSHAHILLTLKQEQSLKQQ